MQFFPKFLYPERKPRGLRPIARLLTWQFRLILRGLARSRTFHVTVIGRHNVPPTGPVIVACNHISMADPVIVWGALRRPAIAIAMAELWNWPIINLLLWLLGHIPVKRGNVISGRRSLARAQRILEHDGAIIIYPEGKISRDGRLLQFKVGVAKLALATGAVIVPAGIQGSEQVAPIGHRRISREPQVMLRFGQPIDPANFTGNNQLTDLLEETRRQIGLLSQA